MNQQIIDLIEAHAAPDSFTHAAPSAALLERVQQELGVTLPEQYIAFLILRTALNVLRHGSGAGNPTISDEKNPIITVNDFNSDLVRTLWCLMDLINKDVVPLNISRCKCCGRLINTAKEAGHTRKYCDSSCRSLHHKRVAAQEKSGKEHIDTKGRREFLEYMESDPNSTQSNAFDPTKNKSRSEVFGF